MGLGRICIVLGSMLLGGFTLAAFDSLFFREAPSASSVEYAKAPPGTAPENLLAPEVTEESEPKRQLASASGSPELVNAPGPAPLSDESTFVSEEEPLAAKELDSKQVSGLGTPAEPVPFVETETAFETVTEADAETAAAPAAPALPPTDLPENQALSDDDNSDLTIEPKLSAGASYLSYKQNGAFGEAHGSSEVFNAKAFQVKMKYGKLHLRSGISSASAKFSTDTANTGPKDARKFQSFYLKPGYKNFFLGIKSSHTPVMRVSGPSIQWADFTSLSAVGGFHYETLYPGRRKRPYILGFDLEGSFPVSGSGDGALTVSSPKGFGISLAGHGSKAIAVHEGYRAFLGLEADLSYDRTRFSGTWSTSSGSVTRTIYEIGSKVYLSLEF